MKHQSPFPFVYPVIVPLPTSLVSVNFYIVKRQSSIVLIDAGFNNEQCWQELTKALNDNGLALDDLSEIILTHHHFDHAGLVNRIAEKHDIKISASPLAIPRLKRDKRYMEARIPFFQSLYEEMGCGDRGLKQIEYLKSAIVKNEDQAIHQEIFPIEGNSHHPFEVIPIPGHAPDQLAFWDEETQSLFSGDLVLGHISSNALIEPDSNGQRLPTLSQHKSSLEKVLSLMPSVIYSGHGEVIREPLPLLRQRIKRIDAKADKFLDMLIPEAKTAADLAKSFYKNTYHEQFSLVMSEVISHLDYLEAQGKVIKTRKGTVWIYQAATTG